ncbi:glycosyltransferase family 2 protein [Halalkalibacter flavus]|uniref:glycosyltransferase family 2 protein n=1 Tax=Halalkalibacter flavus TaxID=3090668 RepID=UPI002FCC805D
MSGIPFFSVVIPTYNRSNLLKEAIDSVLNQSFNDYEIIVVDDYSTDDTKKVISGYSDNRVKLFMNARSKGGGGARNTGIYNAMGKWVAFLDDDDYWLPNKLELQYQKILRLEDDVAILYSGYSKFDFENNEEIRRFYPQKRGYIYNDLLYKNYIGTFSTIAIRRNELLEVEGLDEVLEARQDLDLCIRIAKKNNVDFVNECLVRYRFSNEDRITLNTKKRLQGNLKFDNKYIRKQKDVSLKLKCCSSARIFAFALIESRWDLVFKHLLGVSILPLLDIRYFLSINKIILTSIRK